MIVDMGVYNHIPQDTHLSFNAIAEIDKNAGKRHTGLPDAEAPTEEDDDEDDIPPLRQPTSCHSYPLHHSLQLQRQYYL